MMKVSIKDMKDIPSIGLGTWQLTGQECIDAVSHALMVGYNHIDTAEFYGNEVEIGKAIAKIDRDKLWVTSKVWWGNLKYDKVIEACNNSLKSLQTDYLDVYLVHWPNKKISLDETFKAMRKLLDQDKIKHVGVSNFTIKHLKDAMIVAEKYGFKIYCDQVEFHPLLFQKELLEFCDDNKIKLVAYSPLGHGHALEDNTVKKIAAKKNLSTGQICLKWATQKGIVVIPKSKNKNRIVENLSLDFKLSKEDMKDLDNIKHQERFINPDFSEFDD